MYHSDELGDGESWFLSGLGSAATDPFQIHHAPQMEVKGWESRGRGIRTCTPVRAQGLNSGPRWGASDQGPGQGVDVLAEGG